MLRALQASVDLRQSGISRSRIDNSTKSCQKAGVCSKKQE